MQDASMDEITTRVRDFYAETTVNCSFVCNVNEWDFSPNVKEIVAQLHPETMRRYYGSGIAVPEHVEGKHILDIGCGSGSLVFILSKLVGPTGSVVGMDMTTSQVAVCMNHEDYYKNRWEYEKKNTEFFVGNAENISKLKDKTFDIVVSNGVICLVSNKDRVFQEAYRLLKDGGEFYMNDVCAEKPASAQLKQSEHRAWNLGVLGSQTLEELHASIRKAGFTTPYLTQAGPVKISDAYQKMLPGRYCGGAHRMFRLPSDCKRGPATVTYNGKIKGHESEFIWDVSLTFKKGVAVDVDADLATILFASRYKDAFDFADASGSPQTHKAQNPFTYLDHVSSQGKPIPDIYTLE